MTFERSYEASVTDLWELWTTKDGFESWWGPKGFRVDVQKIEPRVGGALVYEMIAVGPEEIEFMKKTFTGASHATHGTFTQVVPHELLELVHVIDFVPGSPPTTTACGWSSLPWARWRAWSSRLRNTRPNSGPRRQSWVWRVS